MILRPYGIVLDGALEVGLELEILGDGSRVVRPHTGLPEPYILTPAFVNAHSHLEYRGFQGKVQASGYWNWIREITRLKPMQSDAEVIADCLLAADENRATGVYRIEEHSDRIGAAAAMRKAGLQGPIYQELITFFEHASPAEKLAQTAKKASEQGATVNPHATYTVDPHTLKGFAGKPISLHVAETELENAFFQTGSGEIADFHRQHSIPFEPTGKSAIATMDAWGLASPGAQFVHCCAASQDDLMILARQGVRVAHCPRSNVALGCPAAPIREMLDLGIEVGLGLDSAASSGPIDMFQEMRCALEVSCHRGKPLTAREVWRMATSASSILEAPLVKLHVPLSNSIEEVLEVATPNQVEWTSLTVGTP